MEPQSLPSPRPIAEDPPSLIQGKEPIVIIKLKVLLSHIAMLKKMLLALNGPVQQFPWEDKVGWTKEKPEWVSNADLFV